MVWQEVPLDRIYFDSDTGVPGTTWPIGTPSVPSDVIADVITICVARNLHKINVHGALTLGAAMAHYCFFGSEHEDVTDVLDLSGEAVDGSHIEALIVTGGQGGTGFLTLVRCIVNTLTDFQGRMNWCSFWSGTCSFKNASYIDLVDCESIYGAVTITVQAPARASIKNWRGNLILSAQDGGTCYVRGYKGTLVIDGMTAGDLSIYANGADITINVSCTGTGTINIYGSARVTDNHGAGTTVNDYTLEGRLGTPAGASMSVDIAALQTALDALGLQYVEGSVSDAGPAAADFDTDLTEDTDNHYNGMLLMFTDGVCAGQAHVIDDYDGTDKNVAFSAEDVWTDVPGDGDNFIILPSGGAMAKAIYAALGTHDTDIKALLDTMVMGRLQVAVATWDGHFGNGGGGTDTLFTVVDQDIIVEALIVKMTTVDLTDDDWTALSIQDDYATTPHTFIDATTGAKANLAINAQLAWTGAVYLDSGKHITATAIDADANEDALIIVIIKYRAVVDGGYVS